MLQFVTCGHLFFEIFRVISIVCEIVWIAIILFWSFLRYLFVFDCLKWACVLVWNYYNTISVHNLLHVAIALFFILSFQFHMYDDGDAHDVQIAAARSIAMLCVAVVHVVYELASDFCVWFDFTAFAIALKRLCELSRVKCSCDICSLL